MRARCPLHPRAKVKTRHICSGCMADRGKKGGQVKSEAKAAAARVAARKGGAA